MCKENITFSSFFILFHPFSSKKAEKGRKRQKKAGTGRDTSFPSENLKPVVWPYGREYPSCPRFTKKANLFLSPFFCCVVALPSNTIFVRKTIISLHPFSSFFILFHPFSSFFFEKGRKRQENNFNNHRIPLFISKKDLTI